MEKLRTRNPIHRNITPNLAIEALEHRGRRSRALVEWSVGTVGRGLDSLELGVGSLACFEKETRLP